MRTAAVILAAGGSRRMGRAKHLLRLPDGRTMPCRAADAAAEAGCDPVVVVLGPDAEEVAATLGPHRHVINDRWPDGMGGSIRIGVDAVADTDAVLLALADQPRVTSSELRQLMDAARDSGAAASAYAGTIGVPACLHRPHFAALRSLDPAAGAKVLLQSLPNLAVIDLPAAADDADTPEDAERLSLS